MTQPGNDEAFALTASRGFNSWLAATGGSLAVTTYQAGKVIFIGLNPDSGLSIFERTFPRAMGLGASPDGRSLCLAAHYQIFRLDNVLPSTASQDGYDALFAPHQSWITGDLDIHGIEFDADGSPVFVNTAFNCLARTSSGYSFRPVWRPAFISTLVAEDRCHLNGLAMVDGRPGYVTCVSTSDVVDGWRDHRRTGGVVVDVVTNECIARGLSMPHSPCVHGETLWVINSGSGEFGLIDQATGRFEAIAFCPGYARGLAMIGRYAILGLSKLRENRTFQGLLLEENLLTRNAEPRCGLMIVDIETGDTVEWIRIEGVVSELFDVSFLPGIKCPSAIGLKGTEILKVISIDDGSP